MKLRLVVTSATENIVITKVYLERIDGSGGPGPTFDCCYDRGEEAWLSKAQADWLLWVNKKHWSHTIEVTRR